MTRGARFSRAVAIAPTALPRPAVVCNSTRAGRPFPSAQPVAIPTTEPSCRPRTKSRSAGRSASIGTSVDPGFAKMVVISCRLMTATTASRTVLIGHRPYCPAGGLGVVWRVPGRNAWRAAVARRRRHYGHNTSPEGRLLAAIGISDGRVCSEHARPRTAHLGRTWGEVRAGPRPGGPGLLRGAAHRAGDLRHCQAYRSASGDGPPADSHPGRVGCGRADLAGPLPSRPEDVAARRRRPPSEDAA